MSYARYAWGAERSLASERGHAKRAFTEQQTAKERSERNKQCFRVEQTKQDQTKDQQTPKTKTAKQKRKSRSASRGKIKTRKGIATSQDKTPKKTTTSKADQRVLQKRKPPIEKEKRKHLSCSQKQPKLGSKPENSAIDQTEQRKTTPLRKRNNSASR